MNALSIMTDLRPYYEGCTRKKDCTTELLTISGSKNEIRRICKYRAAGIMSDELEIYFNDGNYEYFRRHGKLWYKA